MKTSELLITAIITILGIFPFVWFTYLGKKGMSKNKKIIKELVKAQNLTLNPKEQWNNSFIGIDEGNKVLLYVKVKPSENETKRIDLNDVKSCKILKDTKDIKREKKIEPELQKLDLELELYGKPNHTINLYNIDDNLSEDFEMKRAEFWQKNILKNLAKASSKGVAA